MQIVNGLHFFGTIKKAGKVLSAFGKKQQLVGWRWMLFQFLFLFTVTVCFKRLIDKRIRYSGSVFHDLLTYNCQNTGYVDVIIFTVYLVIGKDIQTYQYNNLY